MRTILAMTLVLMSAAAAAEAAGPIVIAHRGASGYVPEHTLEAYAMAHAMGAHYIEPDLVLTKDGVFICLHDTHLEGTTNVEEVYPERAREDGRWYAADFTLAEIKLLEVHERLPGRFPQGKASFTVPSFAEMIELVQGLNKTTGREAGIYPEIKGPSFHREEGLPMEAALLAVLSKYGYEGPDAKCFVQCFEVEPLKRIRLELGSSLPLIQLISGNAVFAGMLSVEGLEDIAAYADGIGPAKSWLERDPTVVERAHGAGLLVHPYTLRADAVGGRYDSHFEEVAQFYGAFGVDGAFTDHPDQTLSALREIKNEDGESRLESLK